MRSRNITLAGVFLEDFWAQDLVAEVLHCFWGEELEVLRDGHRRDAHSFIIPDVFHGNYALRRLESEMLVRLKCRGMWLVLAIPFAREWHGIGTRDCCWHFGEGSDYAFSVDEVSWLRS